VALGCLGASRPQPVSWPRLSGRPGLPLFQNLILEGDAFRVILREPCLRGIGIREHLDVLGIANLLAGVDVD
jgi:hypothetical protein